MGFDHMHNTEDFREAARRRLPAPLFHYIDGGADDEWTMNRNTRSFEDVRLIPEGLADLSNMDLSVEVLGAKLDWPLFMSPTGMTRLFHHDGERAVAKAAAKFGTMYSLSTLSTVSIEEIGALTDGPKCFQIYIHKDRDLTYEFVERCKKGELYKHVPDDRHFGCWKPRARLAHRHGHASEFDHEKSVEFRDPSGLGVQLSDP